MLLLLLSGTVVAFMGIFVSSFTSYLLDLKFRKMNYYLQNESSSNAYFSILGFSCVYALAAAILCWKCPQAAGGGIAEVKSYLNGVNLNKAVRIEVLFTKIVGVCFSCAAGLPLGIKESIYLVNANINISLSASLSNTTIISLSICRQGRPNDSLWFYCRRSCLTRKISSI
jgi:H+/Cl- antiporter ClcA